MERLTDKCWRNLDPWECCGQDKFCKRGCHDVGGCNNGCIVPILYDYEEKPYEYWMQYYETSDGSTFYEEENAVEYELNWLRMPAEGEQHG